MRLLFLFLFLLACGVRAAAADLPGAGPQLGPAPAWIAPVAIPAPNPALRERPVQSLLMAAEGRYTADGRFEYHVETANLIQTPEGLAALGTLVLPWQPDVAELTVNKVRILRDGKAIDLLKGGQPFTVLRRENNLEAAMLDGVLTAMMQPEGLIVGDVLNVAFTLRSKPRTIAFQPEDITLLAHGWPVRRLHYRQLWEKGVPMRWHSTEAMGKPRIRTTEWGTELLLDRDDAHAPEVPEGSPPRYWQPARLELTAYGDWSEISRLLAPVFAAATGYAPDSPLKAEVEAIARSTSDPKRRAMAALRLVEDKVRYFALTMGDGGYVPTPPDQTWSRKFGDCKAKTVLLLALLKALGIDAEPVLVSTAGDTLSVRMPQLHAFDHVIVRATLGGRDYWLDGTRSGDRDLEALASTPFRWGLPLRTAGAKLEALPLLPPAAPLLESRVTYDGSKGFLGSVPVTGEIVYRGDMATGLRIMLQQMGVEEFGKQVRRMAPSLPGGEDVKFEFKPDDERGTFAVSFTGTERMNWNAAPGARSIVYRFDNGTIRWEPDFKRDSTAADDIPFALTFPMSLDSTETIILPGGGAGFVIEGKSFDRNVAGTHIARTISLEGGRAVARSIFHRLKPEIGAPEARCAEPVLKEINADIAGVRATATYRMPEADKKAVLEREPESAEGYNQRGYFLLQEPQLARALADFDKAIELQPSFGRAHANRGVTLVHLRRFDEAEAALGRARELGPDDFVVHQGLGMLHLGRDRPQEAVEALNRSLQLDPDNRFTLGVRLVAYEQLGKLREALADADRILKLDPEARHPLWETARLHAALGEADAALAANARLLALEPGDPHYLGNRGELLSRLGRKDEAMAAWAEAIARIDEKLKAPGEWESQLLHKKIMILILRRDHKAAVTVADGRLRRYPGAVPYLALRCLARAEGSIELDLARKDCDDAIRFDSGAVGAFEARGLINLRLARWDAAVADYSAALAITPQHYRALYGRGIARLRKGERESGERDLAAARRLSFDVDSEYAWSGITP